ncbi:GGDEF domain-containing protein [Paenibacillus spongiae]|uniref:GGDEF domain-containing protein n=1 Tax=Paenibacillus spongiae TaxID=2909671 RepID=A0ABY5S3J8_9BACL|nr:GGDEF domain-containing protein [Paenibacillus spongiae]UVI28486.1 GGDEF domain-containing protein [Paenibacillus spongiae]
MDEIGFGLLDRNMLHVLTERGHKNGIGVIAVQVHAGHAEARERLQNWSDEQNDIIWRYRIDHEYYYFLQGGKSAQKLALRLEAAAALLQKNLNGSSALTARDRVQGHQKRLPHHIGFAKAIPLGMGAAAEARIYKAIKEALLSTARPERSGERVMEPLLWAAPAAEQSTADWSSTYPMGNLARDIPVFDTQKLVSDAAKLFESNHLIQGAAVVKNGAPVGLVMKENMHQLLAGQFGLPLYWSRPIHKIMDDNPLIVDEGLPVEQVSQLAMSRDISRLYDIVLITRGNKLLGAASIRSILECITSLRTEEARTANPLTGLPGNGVIRREMQRYIDRGQPFSIIYADLDYFKWFNDCFGFSQGDELIRYMADLLQESVRRLSGSEGSFVGHIGGDDFIVLTAAGDPRALCASIIERFEDGVQAFYGDTEVSGVTDRSGSRIEQRGIGVSLSLLRWNGEQPVSPDAISQAAARLKKQAKAVKGSAWVTGDLLDKQDREERMQT